MMDFSLGDTILDRIDKNQCQKMLDVLEGKGVMPKQEIYALLSPIKTILSVLPTSFFFMGLSLLTPLFKFEKTIVENI